ncbi:MAG: hypothetical protein RL272_217 [Candidatus Parcubacteria bacterium]|jgi:hypothetical protein
MHNGSPDADGIKTLSLKEVAADPRLVDDVIGWYIAVFNAKGPGEWNEDWTPEQVRKKLFEDTAAEADRSFVALWRKDGVLAGVHIICLMPAAGAIIARDLPPGFQDEATVAAVTRQLEWIAGPSAVVAMFRELGIRQEFRKGIDPFLGMTRAILQVGLSAGATFGCFWTSRDSNIFPIMIGYGAEVLYDFGDEKKHVFIGDHFDHSYRRFCAPPASAVRMIAERCALRGVRASRGK